MLVNGGDNFVLNPYYNFPQLYDFDLTSNYSSLAQQPKLNPSNARNIRVHKKPKRKINENKFEWDAYLMKLNSKPVPERFFSNPFPLIKNKFKVGMRLEGVNPFNESTNCILNVAQCQGTRLRLNIDGLDHTYDFWRNVDSGLIFPIGYSHRNGLKLKSTTGFGLITSQELASYIKNKLAPVEFTPVTINNDLDQVKLGMKLEAVDIHNPIIIRPATVCDVDYSIGKLQIHYDNWPNVYDVWLDKDSEDLHPIGWCERTGHFLTRPLNFNSLKNMKSSTCPILGCTGVGHAQGYKFTNHFSESGCPYSLKYLNKKQRFVPPAQLVLSNSNSYFSKINAGQVLSSISDIHQVKLRKLMKNKTKGIKRKNKLNGRGRVGKKKQTTVKNKLIINFKYHTTDQDLDEQGERSVEAEIRESVYVAKIYESVLEEEESIQKYNRMLVDAGIKNKNLVRTCGLEVFVNRFDKPDVCKWSCDDVSEFINFVPNCSGSAELFASEEIDGEALLLIKEYDLIKLLNLKLGEAIKIYNYIKKLKFISSNQNKL